MKLKATAFILFASLLYDITSASLSVSLESVVKQENDTLIVSCKDKDTGEAASWRSPKKQQLGERTTPQAKMTTSYGTQLRFTKIRKGDAGTYTCKSRSYQAEFTLFVEGPVEFVDTPSEQIGEEGADVSIKCEATGSNIEWAIDGEPPTGPKYEKMGDGLLIKNASKEDATKTYICKAVSEGRGFYKEKSINLRILHPPRLPSNTTEKHYMKEEIVYGYIGGEVILTCQVEAEPPPRFEWFNRKNGKKIGKEIDDPNPYASTIMLLVTEAALGDYMCRASNDHGRLEIIFSLLNGSQPSPPTTLSLKEANSNALILEIDGPQPTQEEMQTQMIPLGYRVEYRPFDKNETEWMAQSFALTEDRSYALSELAHSTPYEVRVATENRAGLSDFTNTSIFLTEPNSAGRVHSNLLSVASTIFSFLLIISNGIFDKHI